ncbi:MAG: cation:proton antiporter [Chloroflexia bacterium]|jgi:NhaP-type Na+/H+ or K+/H+ antiporter|nr:cation:proton antiporter [Chloroflexia bacterium]
MDPYFTVLTMIGVASIGAAVLPRIISDKPFSFPIIYVLIGFVVFLFPLGLDLPDPLEHIEITKRLTELVVIVSLMGAGLKLDRNLGRNEWRSTMRLMAVTMPLTIALAALLGWWAVGLAPATAVLLGAALAPTDPVLASDVQVGPPGEGREDETRFTLTAEAGLNDGLAFPFTNMAVAMAVAGSHPAHWIGEWLAVDVAYKILVGTVAGIIMGRFLAIVIFRWMRESLLTRSADGFVALGATFLVYGLTELIGGYGFLAVFVAAYTLRRQEQSHEYHTVLHRFTEEIERMLSAALLMIFGGALVGGLLGPLTWEGALVGVLLVLVVRPLTGYLATSRTGVKRRERAAIGFFGIRGVGSFYYLAYAAYHAEFEGMQLTWAIASFVVVLSIVVHGITAGPIMQELDRHRPQTMRDQHEAPTRVSAAGDVPRSMSP